MNDDFTVDQLPKEGDEAVVVPCLWDSKKGKIQFVDKYPPQLLGICKPEGAQGCEHADAIRRAPIRQWVWDGESAHSAQTPFPHAHACFSRLCRVVLF